jgi:hypothetical protein
MYPNILARVSNTDLQLHRRKPTRDQRKYAEYFGVRTAAQVYSGHSQRSREAMEVTRI